MVTGKRHREVINLVFYLQDMTSLISPEGMNQLSIFIFVLAVMQIVYSVLTMALGRAKVR